MMRAYLKRSVPGLGLVSTLALGRKLMASFPPALLARVRPSPCYRNAKEHRGSRMKRSKELSGHSSLTNAEARGDRG
jgi:hypothetical protein